MPDKTERPPETASGRRYLLLSFFLPFVIFGTSLALNGAHPFGDRQILVYDFWHQYYPFMSDFWHRLRDGSSLLWSWSAGAGSDFLGLFAYYLASPVNLLTAFLPHAALRDAMAAGLLFKLGFAGLFTGLYLKNVFGKTGPLIPAFASFYALCAFTLGYFWNIMWYDTFAMLPLVALGVHALVTEGRFRLYIAAIALSVLMNYYISLFSCVFAALYFFCLCAARKVPAAALLRKTGRIAVCSCVAIALTAFLIFPAYSALQKTHGASNAFPESFVTFNSYFDVIGNFIAFTPPTKVNGLPNLYSGMLSLMLCGAALRSPRVKLRVKLLFMALAAFLVVSANLNVLDFIWHGFHYTNSLPFRFTFLLSFIITVMGYRAWLLLDGWDRWDLLAMAVSAAIFISAVAIGSQKKIHVIASAALCFTYLLLFAVHTVGKKLSPRALGAAVLAVAVAEISITAYVGVEEVGSSDYTGYPNKYDTVRQLLESREPQGNGFYRTEFTELYTTNDPSLYGFTGINLFSSTVNVSSTKFMKGLGLQYWEAGNSYGYAETSPLAGAFLNIRYLVSRDGNPHDDGVYWERVNETDGSLLMENKYYLPLGFMAEESLADYSPEGINPFLYQNELLQKAAGLDGELFTLIDMLHVGHDGYDVRRGDLGDYTYTLLDGVSEGTLKWNYEAPKDGMLYIFCDIENADEIRLTRGDSTRTIQNTRPYLFAAGSFEEGETFSILSDIEAQSGDAHIFVASINHELFEEAYDILSGDTLNITDFSDTVIKGSVDASRDGLLYTSIPSDNGGWSVYVDGEKSETVLINGCMVGVRLGAGSHDLEFRYANKSFAAGVAVSLIAAAALVLLLVLDKRAVPDHRVTRGDEYPESGL